MSARSKISALAAAIPSIEPTRSRCMGPIDVITAICGLIHEQSSLISPGLYIPISAMRTSALSVRCSLIVLARPASLLYEAGEATTTASPARRSRTCCLVDVFPQLPVTAITTGDTLDSRISARRRKESSSRFSSGAITAAAMPTTAGTSAATSARAKPGPTSRPHSVATAAHAHALRADSRMRRRVKRRRGSPVMLIGHGNTAVHPAKANALNEATLVRPLAAAHRPTPSAATATVARPTFGGRTQTQRPANLMHEPAM